MRILCNCMVLLLLLGHSALGQKQKPEVLVWGNGPGAIATGLQSARSGVKTLLISDASNWGLSLPSHNTNYTNPAVTRTGIWAELVKKYGEKQGVDFATKDNIRLAADTLSTVLKAICDTVKNLEILPNTAIRELKKSGNGWQVRLSNGEKLSVRVLVDASANRSLLNLSGGTAPASGIVKAGWNEAITRTSVAALDSGQVLPIRSLIAEKVDNVILVPDVKSIRSLLHAGQAAGASAAYCAFFKTDTKNLNVRMIQGELLNYKSSLIPLYDVLPSDTNFIKIQHLAASGLLNRGIAEKNNSAFWMSENNVSTEELKSLMKAFYSRSQIWFADHSSAKLSIEETINLLMYTATRGEELRKVIEKDWKTEFGFKNDYDAKRPISRYELAVLMDTYLKPFSVRIDLEGNLLN